jgi:uncharacterized delta-60 repeat protein
MTIRPLFFILVILFNILYVSSQSIDTGFSSPIPLIEAEYEDILVTEDGKIYVAGFNFFYEGTFAKKLVRIFPDGSLDKSFTCKIADHAEIDHLDVKSNGNIITEGIYSICELDQQGNVIHNIDTTYGFTCIKVQDDDKILVGGTNTQFGLNFFRLNADFTMDTAFNNKVSANGYVRDIEIYNNKIYVVGGFSEFNGTEKNNIVRLTMDGTIDNTFDVGSGTSNSIGSITLQPDGRILLGNTYTYSFNGETFMSGSGLLRLNTDGSCDNTFIAKYTSDQPCGNIVIQNDTLILLSAQTKDISTENNVAIFCLKMDGSIDSSFNPIEFCKYSIPEIALTNDSLLFAGHSCLGSEFGLSKASPKGVIDDSFSPEIWNIGSISSIAMNDTSFYVSGYFKKLNDHLTTGLAKLNFDGSVDNSFTYNTDLEGVDKVEILVDGDLLITSDTNFIRINPDGSIDPSFHFNTFEDLYKVAKYEELPDGKIMVSGFNNFYRLNTNGTRDMSYHNGTGTGGANSTAQDFDFQSTGKLIYGAAFDSYNGTPVDLIMRIDTNGYLDTTFQANANPGPDDFGITNVVVLPNDEIIVGAFLNNFNGNSVKNVFKLGPDGAFDETFQQSDYFYHIEENKGSIFVFGNDTTKKEYVIEKLDYDGVVDSNFVFPQSIELSFATIQLAFPKKDSTLMYIVGNSKVEGSDMISHILRINIKTNIKPIITGTTGNLLTSQGIGIKIKLTDLTVEDPDNNYPNDFTLRLLSGSNYSLEGNTVNPDDGFIGNLSVPAIVNDGFIDSDTYVLSIVVKEGDTRIEEITKQLRIYPNPVGDHLNISSIGKNETLLVKVYDIHGNTLINFNKTSNDSVIDLHSLLPGVYFLQVITEDSNIYAFRIIKK